jgi:hypothetical protein
VYLYTTNAVMPHPQHRTGENRTSVLWADTLGITGEGSNAGL